MVTGDPKLRQAAQHSYSITVKKELRNTSKRGQKTLRIGSRGSLIYVSLTLQHSTQPVIYNKFSVSEKPLALLSANGVINSAIGCFEHCGSHSYHGRHKMLCARQHVIEIAMNGIRPHIQRRKCSRSRPALPNSSKFLPLCHLLPTFPQAPLSTLKASNSEESA